MYLQQIYILGRATRDGEIVKGKEGDYARLSVAVDDTYGKDAKKTTYYHVVIFNKTHERAVNVRKGDLVLIDGRPDVDAYITKDGEAKASMVVFAEKWRIMK